MNDDIFKKGIGSDVQVVKEEKASFKKIPIKSKSPKLDKVLATIIMTSLTVGISAVFLGLCVKVIFWLFGI